MNPPHQNYQTPTPAPGGDESQNPQFKQIPNQQNVDPQRQMNQPQNITIKQPVQAVQGQNPQMAGQQGQQNQIKVPKAFQIIGIAQQQHKSSKMEAQRIQKQVTDQKYKENIKRVILAHEKTLRNKQEYLEDQKKLCQMNVNDLLTQIHFMANQHKERYNEMNQNIQKNTELLNFLKQYKANNPQSNFQERENNSQQIANNFSKDDSFELMVEESSKEVKMNNQQQQQIQQQEQEYAQMQIDQQGYDQNQYPYDDTQNNQLLEGNQMNQYDDNGMQDEGYVDYT